MSAAAGIKFSGRTEIVRSGRFSIAANVKPRSIPLTARRVVFRLPCHTGLSLLFEVGVRPPHDGIRRMGRPNLSGALAADSGRISGRYELTPPVVPVRTFFCRSRTR